MLPGTPDLPLHPAPRQHLMRRACVEGTGVRPGMAVKTVPGSLGAGKQRLAEKLLSQQLQTEPPSQPTRPGSKAGLNPGNPLLPRASCWSDRGQGLPWEELSQDRWGCSAVFTALPPKDLPCELPVSQQSSKARLSACEKHLLHELL